MAVVVDEAALEGFDAHPGGPALAAAVEFVDPATLTGQDTAAWMRAGFRVRNHADWLLLRAIREACRARADTTTRVPDDEFAPKIAAASLGWSTTTAGSRLDLAVGVLERMPALGQRMRTGELELVKAAAYVTQLEGLTDAQCADVLARTLDEAPDLPLGQLRDRILDAAYAVDPVWATNRLAAATARARVTRESAPSGAVNLCGRDLPPDLAQDAAVRLRTLALTVRARLRAAGAAVALGFIEARVFIRLMDGTQAGAADTEVITAVTTELLATPGTPDPDDDGPNDGGPDDDDGPGDGPHDGSPSGNGSSDDGGGHDSDGDHREPSDIAPRAEPDEPGPDGGGSDGGGSDGGAPDERLDAEAGASTAGDDPGGGPQDADPAAGSDRLGEQSVVFAPGVALRLPLSTLLGLDDQPGTLPGTGPIPAGSARATARSYGAATWQVLVHDEHGHLQHLLVLRGPPGTAHDARHRRQTVQLTAPAELLPALTLTGLDDGTGIPRARPLLLGEATTAWLQHAHEALVRSRTADPEDHPATTTRDRDRRFPGAALARWVAARDQTCIGLGCNRPAEACDIDHTLDWNHGGRTEAGDLDLLCRHDHRAKHEGGWHYEQPTPGCFVITDPTGTRHQVRSRVAHPRPAPRDPGHGVSPDQYRPRPRPDWAPNRTRDGRITEEARATTEHLTRRAREQEGAPPSRYDHDPDF